MAGTRDPHIDLDPAFVGPEETREARVRAGFWSTVKRAARRIPFMPDVVAAYYCALDPETPTKVRLTLLAALAYFVAPIDAIPDILPVIGFTDDATVLMAAIAMVRNHIRDDHREAARSTLAED